MYKRQISIRAKSLDAATLTVSARDNALWSLVLVGAVPLVCVLAGVFVLSLIHILDPGELAPYFGFTEEEVKVLCAEYAMSFEEAKAWYDGYGLVAHSCSGVKNFSMYSPKSVVEAMLRHKFGPYWNQTETYEALKIYIQMNYDGLKDAVVAMLAGENVRINTGTFANDMTTFSGKDDVLTLLVHLGYLTYNSETAEVAIPNKEVSQEYVNAISTMNWPEVTRAVEESRELLKALWAQDGACLLYTSDVYKRQLVVWHIGSGKSYTATYIDK